VLLDGPLLEALHRPEHLVDGRVTGQLDGRLLREAADGASVVDHVVREVVRRLLLTVLEVLAH
jgi:hypothetical protein